MIGADRFVTRLTRRCMFLTMSSVTNRAVEGMDSTDGGIVRRAGDEVSLTRDLAADRAGRRMVATDRRFTDVTRSEFVCRVISLTVRAVSGVIRTQCTAGIDGVVTVFDAEATIADEALTNMIRTRRVSAVITFTSVVGAVMLTIRCTNEEMIVTVERLARRTFRPTEEANWLAVGRTR